MTHFFTFHTGSRYGLLARKCVRSFAAFDVKVESEIIPGGKYWIANCMQRALRIEALAKQYPEDNICLLDADLVCLKRPDKLIDPIGDISVHDLTDTQPGKSHPCYRFSAGVLLFSPTPHGRSCLSRWANLCRVNPLKNNMLCEQQYLYTAIREGTHDKLSGGEKKRDFLVVTNVGEAYNRIIDRYVEGDDTVILHKVASRKMKKRVDSEYKGSLARTTFGDISTDTKYRAHFFVDDGDLRREYGRKYVKTSESTALPDCNKLHPRDSTPVEFSPDQPVWAHELILRTSHRDR